jgi:hypothetical protein
VAKQYGNFYNFLSWRWRKNNEVHEK